MITILRMSNRTSKQLTKEEFIMKELEKTPSQAMLSFMPFTPSYAIFYAMYPTVVLFFNERYATVHNTNP